MFEAIWMLIKFLLVVGPVLLYFAATFLVIKLGSIMLYVAFTTALKDNKGQTRKQILIWVVSLALIYIFLRINLAIDLIGIWFAPIQFLANFVS